MIDKNYLKAISCFCTDGDANKPLKEIEFKENDSLNYCREPLCRYTSFSKEKLHTIRNTPAWGEKSFRFSAETVKNGTIANQRIIIDGEWQEQGFSVTSGEWRRCLFENSLESWWGEWVNIENTINLIKNDKRIQKFLATNWDQYIIINKHVNHRYGGCIRTIDEIIDQIKTGTAKMYENKLL